MENKFEYEIVKHFGNLSEFVNKDGVSVTKEINKVSYGGKEARIDLRVWKRKDSDIRMFKGLTLTNAEALELYNILGEMKEAGVI